MAPSPDTPASPPPLPADLTARVVAFAGRLRAAHGFLIGPGEVTDALRALGVVDVLHPREVRDALRLVFTASPAQARVFDAEFDAFFRSRSGPPPPELPPLLPQTEAPPPPPRQVQGDVGEPRPVPGESRAEDPPEEGEEATSGRTPPRETEGDPDDPADPPRLLQARLSPHAGEGGRVEAGEGDLPELLRAAGALVRAVELGRARRRVPMPRGTRLDARRTLRGAAKTAGDPARLRWLGRPRRSPRFLIVLDGSRSMGQGATLLLRFAHALHLRARRVEVYAFSTALTRLTPTLRGAPPGEALRLPDLGDAWGGGTRIGENLLRLARDERARVTRDTVVLILSDGLDTGEPEVLSRALRDLAGRAGLLAWLSPLAATPGYQPVQRAVQAALPHLDAFLPAGGVGDLHALARALRGRW